MKQATVKQATLGVLSVTTMPLAKWTHKLLLLYFYITFALRSLYINSGPQGQYCPTADVDPIPCPAGKFCPWKTSKPEINCNACGEGEEELPVEEWGVLVVILILAFFLIYWILWRVRGRAKDLKRKLDDLTSRQYDAAQANLRRRKRQKELERLKPKLIAIQQRLERWIEEQEEELSEKQAENSSGTLASIATKSVASYLSGRNPKSVVSNKSAVSSVINVEKTSSRYFFHAGRLFDALDTDKDGVIGYDDLHHILELNPIQMNEFIRRLNELANDGSDQTTVLRPCFVRYFLRVLDETSYFGPTNEEVDDLFDEIAGGEELDVAAFSDFYLSSMAKFLSDTEIHELISAYQRINDDLRETEKAKEDEGSSSGFFGRSARSFRTGQVVHENNPPPTHGRRMRSMLSKSFAMSFFGGANMMGEPSPDRKYVTRDVFCENYSDLLMQITLKEDPMKVKPLSAELSVADAENAGMDLSFEDLSLAVSVGSEKVNVVNHVTGRIHAGQMTALMGGSGAGKTSLLNALCGRAFYGETSGKEGDRFSGWKAFVVFIGASLSYHLCVYCIIHFRYYSNQWQKDIH